MKPPKKKECEMCKNYEGGLPYCEDCPCVWNYNQAIDDYEKWIDEAPIEEVVKLSCTSQLKLLQHEDVQQAIDDMDELAKAIRQLLKGEK